MLHISLLHVAVKLTEEAIVIKEPYPALEGKVKKNISILQILLGLIWGSAREQQEHASETWQSNCHCQKYTLLQSILNTLLVFRHLRNHSHLYIKRIIIMYCFQVCFYGKGVSLICLQKKLPTDVSKAMRPCFFFDNSLKMSGKQTPR